jgi:hypothetical protein
MNNLRNVVSLAPTGTDNVFATSGALTHLATVVGHKLSLLDVICSNESKAARASLQKCVSIEDRGRKRPKMPNK